MTRYRSLDWSRDSADWPHAAASRFVVAANLRWHVQTLGPTGVDRDPLTLFLIHGTGASTHSWRDLAPSLAERHRVVMVDLPGHGFTERPPAFRLSLTGMVEALKGLLEALNVSPDIAIGHSAGAAILAQLCLDRAIAPAALISLNGALLPFRGRAGRTFPNLAKLLFANPLVPWLFALGAARPARVGRLIENTGSHLDEQGLLLYARLFSDSRHAGAALGMMARWDLDRLDAALPQLPTPLWLIVGTRDRAVPPEQADAIAARVPGAQVRRLPGLGHLAHEEDSVTVAALVETIINEAGAAAGET